MTQIIVTMQLLSISKWVVQNHNYILKSNLKKATLTVSLKRFSFIIYMDDNHIGIRK